MFLCCCYLVHAADSDNESALCSNSTTFFALRSLVQLAQITSILTLSTFQLSTLINGTGSASSASTTTNTSSGQVLGTSETTSTGSASASATAPSTTPILDVGHQTGQNFLPSIPIPKPGTTGRPNILLILALNALCLFVHFFTDAPTASEVTRFYMHGSIIIDFIGQRAMGGWTSKMRLCAMDLLVAALQVTAIGVVAELLVKKDVVKSVNVMSEGRAGERVGDAVRRFWEATGIGSVGGRRGGADVEMQPLRDGRRREDEGEEEEEQQAQVPRSPMDMYNSGQAVVADLNLVDTVRQQFWELRNTRLAGQV